MTKINPRITFGMIVLNGEPFLLHNLRSIYEFAHQIIVVEGASPGAIHISTEEGHSQDKTLQILHEFKNTEDSENKLIIVTAEDEGNRNGFWPGEKHEQSQAYSKRATGNFLWQIDVDEFYQKDDLEKIINILAHSPEISTISFIQKTFWGSLEYEVDGMYLRWGANEYHRLFKWGIGYKYISHRPPTVIDENGIDLRKKNWIRGKKIMQNNIFLFHYSLLFPKQVKDKVNYYSNAKWNKSINKMISWANNNYFNLSHPFRVHNVYTHISWLQRYDGEHPPDIVKMMENIKLENPDFLRNNSDVEKLVDSLWYKIIRWFYKGLTWPLYYVIKVIWTITNLKKVIKKFGESN